MSYYDKTVKFPLDLPFLRPKQEELQQINHDPQYIVNQVGKNKYIRKIFRNVTYTEFEQQNLDKFKKFLEEQQANKYSKNENDIFTLPEGIQEGDLLKILYGGKFKFQKAFENLQINIEWRNDISFHRLENYKEDILKKGLIYLMGRDIQFRPVIVLDAEKLPKQTDQETQNLVLKSICYFLDQIRYAMFYGGKIENWIIFIDTNGMGISSLPKDLIMKVVKLLQINYGGTLHKLCLLNPSTLLSFTWVIAKAFIDEDTNKKINFYKPKEYTKLLKLIDPNQLEQKYGGIRENIEEFWPIPQNFIHKQLENEEIQDQNNSSTTQQCDNSLISNYDDNQGNQEIESAATRLLEKRRKMYVIHEDFEKEKMAFKKKEEEFKGLEEEIKKDDIEIQMNLIKACKELQENETKKIRSEKRKKEEEQLKSQKEDEIKKIKIEIAKYEEQQKSLEKRVESLKKYEVYLDGVIKQHGDQYSDLTEILNRYKTLSQSNENLVEEHKNLERKQEELKHQSIIFNKEKQSQILQLQNDIKDMTKKLEEKKNERNRLQESLEQTNQESSNKNLDLGRILMAIDNIHNKCNEGMQKIKQDYEEATKNQNKIVEKQNQKNQQTVSKKNKQPENNIEKEESFEEKSKKAEIKLEKIKNFMDDFKNILDGCRQAQLQQQQEQYYR